MSHLAGCEGENPASGTFQGLIFMRARRSVLSSSCYFTLIFVFATKEKLEGLFVLFCGILH